MRIAHIIFMAPIATGLMLFGATAQAAEITTSNDAQGESTSYEGTSNAAVDHMAGEPNDGNLEGDTPTTILRAFHIPVLDENGNVVTDQWGNPVTTIDWRVVPVGDGVPQATVNHN